MFLRGYYQNAYVTHNLDRAIELFGEVYGLKDFHTVDADMTLSTPEGDKPSQVRVGMAWSGRIQIELIQPVSGYLEPYLPYLPADRSDAVPRPHHIAVRRNDLATMRQEARSLGLPLAFESGIPGLQCIFLDARKSLGHYLEFVWASPDGWKMLGWPAGLVAEDC